MKVKVHSLTDTKAEDVQLPGVFDTPIRDDLIKRAVISAQSARYQPYSPHPLAGKQTSAVSIGKGRGIARVRRTSSGRHVGAFVPQAVGGRRAHPPKIEKRIHKKINDKERKLAIRSAIAATSSIDRVKARGHKIEEGQVPLVVGDTFKDISKAGDAREVLLKIGLGNEIERVVGGIHQRAGKGKMRGRRKRVPKGPVCVIDGDAPIKNALSNMPGIDVVTLNNLNTEVLAPGGVPGRLSIWTVSALKKVGENHG
jgi:large subunit ribosomal protein L4e